MGLPQSGPFMFRSGGGGSATAGAAGINYLSAIYSGDTLTGFNTYNDGASATPTDGTGGVVTGLTTALNTSTPLVGTSCVRFSKDASNRQGEGWSYDFTVDDISSDQSNPIYIRMYYRTSANYASSDVRGFLYDVTNGTLLNLNDISNGSGNIIAAPGDAQISWVGFTVQSAGSYRLIWHIASTNASAWDLDLDCFECSPQSVVPGAIQTLPESWTPTGSWVSNTTYTGRKWRIGGYGYYEVTVATTGAPTATQLLVNMPSGEVIDTAQLTNSTAAVAPLLGFGTINDGGSRIATAHVVFSTTSQVAPLYADASVASGGITATAPMTWANGDNVTFFFCAPIVGWAASAALSTTETLFSTAKFAASGDPASAISGNPIIVPTKIYDNLNAYSTSTGLFTAPRTGYYLVHGSGASANAAGIAIRGYVNAVNTVGMGYTDSNGEFSFNGTLYATAGSKISIRPDNTLDAQAVFLFIEEQPDFSIFSTYGTFELLTATSSVKTPSATNNYHQLTGNSLTLTPGTWRLYGTGTFANSGSPVYDVGGGGWFAANGADTSSVPALLSTATGLTVLSVSDGAQIYQNIRATSSNLNYPTVIVRVTQSVTVYLVSYATMTTAANARITVYANAERLQ